MLIPCLFSLLLGWNSIWLLTLWYQAHYTTVDLDEGQIIEQVCLKMEKLIQNQAWPSIWLYSFLMPKSSQFNLIQLPPSNALFSIFITFKGHSKNNTPGYSEWSYTERTYTREECASPRCEDAPWGPHNSVQKQVHSLWGVKASLWQHIAMLCIWQWEEMYEQGLVSRGVPSPHKFCGPIYCAPMPC